MKSDTVWLTNSKPSILHLPCRVKRTTLPGPGGVAVEQVAPAYDGIPVPPSAPREKDGVPQPTAVARSYWDEVARPNAQVQSWMKRGWLTVSEQGAPGTEEPDTLAKYNLATAIALAEGCESLTILDGYAKAEARSEVRQALDARRAFLSRTLPTLPGKAK